MKIHNLFVGLFTLSMIFMISGCMTVAKSDSEFSSQIMTGKGGVQQSFHVKDLSLDEAKSRLERFAGQCLNRVVTQNSATVNRIGGQTYQGVESNSTRYQARIVKENNGLMFFLQRDFVSENSNVHDVFGVMPKGGVYYYGMKLKSGAKSRQIEVTAYLLKATGANFVSESIFENSMTWLVGAGKPCPNLE